MSDAANDPAIQALIRKLPPPDTAWPISERRKWLNAMDNVIAIVYGVEPLGQERIDAMLPQPR